MDVEELSKCKECVQTDNDNDEDSDDDSMIVMMVGYIS